MNILIAVMAHRRRQEQHREEDEEYESIIEQQHSQQLRYYTVPSVSITVSPTAATTATTTTQQHAMNDDYQTPSPIQEIQIRNRLSIFSFYFRRKLSSSVIKRDNRRVRNSTNNSIESNDNNKYTDVNKPQYPFIFTLAKNWAWEAVLHRCMTHPEEAKQFIVDEKGDNILHWCVFGKPPLELIQELVRINPELTKQTNYPPSKNLPIHVACSYRASTAVLKTLLDVYPESAGIRNKQSSTSSRNNNNNIGYGSYPIHILCDYGCPIETFNLFLSNPYIVSSVSKRGGVYQKRPLHILNERKNFHQYHNYLTQLRSMVQHHQAQVRKEKLNEIMQEIENDIFFQKFCMLLLVEYWQKPLPSCKTEECNDSNNNSDNDNHDDNNNNNNNNNNNEVANWKFNVKDYPIILACIDNLYCPPSLQEMILYMYPQQLLQPDKNGQVPLHIVAKRHYVFFSNNNHHCENNLLLEVLMACPEAAYVRDKQGQLPFTYYVTTTTTTTKTNKKNPNNTVSSLSWSPIIAYFLHANPAAIQEIVHLHQKKKQSNSNHNSIDKKKIQHKYNDDHNHDNDDDGLYYYIQIWSQLLRSKNAASVASTQNTIFQSLLQNPTWFCK